jgi:1-deoxyxylulose-5-phosphate synthase
MEYRNVGSTGLKVSRLLFGGSHVGEIIGRDKARELIHAAWDVGITGFYTADKYNNGAGEEIIGPLIKERRDDLVLIIKTGYRVGTPGFPVSDAERLATHGERGVIDHNYMWSRGVPPTSRGLSRKHILQAVEGSLKRLQTEYIDIYEAHYWDLQTPVDETLSAMDTLIQQGKVRYLGCSQTSAWQLYKALWTSDVKGLHRYESMQIRFNVFARELRKEQLAAADAAGVSIFAFNSLAGDVLTGRYNRDSLIPDGLGFRKFYTEMYWSDRNFDLVEQLSTIAAGSERTVGELAQAWTLAQPAVTALQIGPNEPDEFLPQVRAVDRPLTNEEADAIATVLRDFPISPIV